MLGQGSFGKTIKCKDHKTSEFVAIKILKEKKRLYQQAMVEIEILKYINDNKKLGNENFVKLFDFFICFSCILCTRYVWRFHRVNW